MGQCVIKIDGLEEKNLMQYLGKDLPKWIKTVLK